MSETQQKVEPHVSFEAIEQYLQDLSQSAAETKGFASFAAMLLDKLIRLLNAEGGAIWICGSPPDLHLQIHQNLEKVCDGGLFLNHSGHTSFLQSVVKRKQACILENDDGTGSVSSLENSSQVAWLACPIISGSGVHGILEVLQVPSNNTDLSRGSLKLLEMSAELISNFLQQQELVKLKESDEKWRQYELLVQKLNSNLNLNNTAFQIVNGCRVYLNCDRFSLLLQKGTNLKTIAISGTDHFDRRSERVRKLEVLSESVARSNQSLRYRGETDSLAPQLEQPIRDYIDESFATGMDLIPIFFESESGNNRESLGVLVIESFKEPLNTAQESMIPRVTNLARIALRNAVDHNNLPLISVVRFAQGLKQIIQTKRTKVSVACILFLVLLAFLTFTPSSYTVSAEGKVQPQTRRNIYAPSEGEIYKVAVKHNERVVEKQILLELRSPSLELEDQALKGEYLANAKKLLSITAERIQLQQGGDPYGIKSQQLSAREEELQQLIASQKMQMELVEAQKDALNIVSPIQGQVLTWNPVDLLENRPVQRGQRLLTVADTSGAWVLELDVPDRKIGPVLDAFRELKTPVAITFQMATDRGASYDAQLVEISGRTSWSQDQKATVKILANIPKDSDIELVPDATVYAKIDCGTHSLGHVLFYDLYVAVKTWILML